MQTSNQSGHLLKEDQRIQSYHATHVVFDYSLCPTQADRILFSSNSTSTITSTVRSHLFWSPMHSYSFCLYCSIYYHSSQSFLLYYSFAFSFVVHIIVSRGVPTPTQKNQPPPTSSTPTQLQRSQPPAPGQPLVWTFSRIKFKLKLTNIR